MPDEPTVRDGQAWFPSDRTDKSIAIASSLATLMPIVGGVLSNVLSGHGQQRRFNRVQDLFDGVGERFDALEATLDEEYLKTEDFEDLLFATISKAADERSAEVRKLYARFLHRIMTDPVEDYDEQAEIMNALARLREVHFKVLEAIGQEPSAEAIRSNWAGSPKQTLEQRTGLSQEQLSDSVETMEALGLVRDLKDRLTTMMTPHGAHSLQSSVTPLGVRLLEYVGDNSPTGDSPS